MKRKIIYGLLAVLVSFGLWMYVVTVVNPEWEDTFYNIPVVLENEEILQERGLMLVSEEDPKVTLRLSGNRADMINLNASNITIRADLSRIYSAGEQTLGYSIIYPDGVPGNAFEIVNQSPQQITLSVVERKTTNVDVVIDFNDTAVPEGYKAFDNEATLDYEKITVTGPKDVVDRIVGAKAIVDLTDRKESFSEMYEYTFFDADGNAVESDWLTANTQTVRYMLKIQKTMNIPVEVEIIHGAGLTAGDYTLTYYDENNEIIENAIGIAGSEAQLLTLGDTLLLGKIDLTQEIGTNANGGVRIEKTYDVTQLLESLEITNLSGINTVKAVLEIPGVAVREISIRSEKVKMNYDADLWKVEPLANKITVYLRGQKSTLDKVTAQDLTVTVDIDGIGAAFAANVTVSNPALKNVFVVGTYTIDVAVTALND